MAKRFLFNYTIAESAAADSQRLHQIASFASLSRKDRNDVMANSPKATPAPDTDPGKQSLTNYEIAADYVLAMTKERRTRLSLP